MCKIFQKSISIILLSLFALPINVINAQAEEPKYEIADGKVDKGTFNGWRRFHSTCHACHGQDALGSSFAPNLIDSLKTIDYATFVETVTKGRQVTGASGAAAAMPAFGEDPNIMKHIDDLYRFLTARASGGLPPGRPKK
jgi:mono/diheme cytochrome c family protein